MKIRFLDSKTKRPVTDLPDSWPADQLKPGSKIRIHLFGKGWQIYKIKKIEGCIAFVKKCWW